MNVGNGSRGSRTQLIIRRFVMVFVSSRHGGEVIVRKLQDGFQVPGDSFLAPMRSSAARAAHREQARSYICFGPIIPGADAHVPLALTSISRGQTGRSRAQAQFVSGRQGACLGFYGDA